jgi:hypothetical protein
MALANHRKRIRTKIAETGERIRKLVLDALSATSKDYRLPEEAVSPEVLVFLMTSVPRMIVMEEAAGMSTSRTATTGVIERYLGQVEPRPSDRSPSEETETAEPTTAEQEKR